MQAPALIFWTTFALMLYSYLGYPLLLWLLVKLRRRPSPAREPSAALSLPVVSLLFAAHNEQKVIPQKMANLARLDYPMDRLEILIGLDACSDRTAELIRVARHPAVRLLEFRERLGKPAVINRLAAEARGEVLAFSDANTLFEPDALKALVSALARGDVGAACGRMVLTNAAGADNPEVRYWDVESWLKEKEGQLGGVLGANGGIYALRKELFTGIPDNTIIDDFVIAMKVYETGHRVAYAPDAVAHEEVAASVEAEFHRRARIAAGCFQAIPMTWRALNPMLGFPALAYWSHKILRWVTPLLYGLALAANIALVAGGSRFFLAMLLVQACFLGLALAGWWLRNSRWNPPLFKWPYYFVTLNAAFVVGLFRCLRGIRSAAWQRTAR